MHAGQLRTYDTHGTPYVFMQGRDDLARATQVKNNYALKTSAASKKIIILDSCLILSLFLESKGTIENPQHWLI